MLAIACGRAERLGREADHLVREPLVHLRAEGFGVERLSAKKPE